jgi:hypothetical protein
MHFRKRCGVGNMNEDHAIRGELRLRTIPPRYRKPGFVQQCGDLQAEYRVATGEVIAYNDLGLATNTYAHELDITKMDRQDRPFGLRIRRPAWTMLYNMT